MIPATAKRLRLRRQLLAEKNAEQIAETCNPLQRDKTGVKKRRGAKREYREKWQTDRNRESVRDRAS